MSVIDDVLAGYEAMQPAQEAFYKDLHRHPELSHHEQRTAGNPSALQRHWDRLLPLLDRTLGNS